jgi:hypothetical protein
MFRGGGLAFGPFFGAVDAAARYLGLTDAQLRDRLLGGKSLADIAKAQGKSPDGLKAAIRDAVKAKLDKAVASKALTQAREDRILSRLDARLDEIVKATLLPGPRTFFRPGGPAGGLRFHPGG